MPFHIVGTACVATSIIGFGLNYHPICTEYENPMDFPTYIDCHKAVDKSTPFPDIPGYTPDKLTWLSLHCIQLPDK
jgi:hypothetical protein